MAKNSAKLKRPLIEVRKIKKFFPLKRNTFLSRGQIYVRAVEDVTFDIYKGETFGLVGESGCGKSTLGRIILQLYPPTSGSAVYFGTKPEDMDLHYIVNEIKKLPKYQKHAIDRYNKSLRYDEQIINLKKEIASIETTEIVDKSYNAKVKRVEKLSYLSREMKKEASRQLREASRTVGSLILEENIEEIKELLLQASDLVKHNSGILEGLNGQEWEGMNPKAKVLFDKIIEFKGKNTLAITERTLDKKYQNKLESNRETGLNLARLDYEEMRHLRRKLQIIFQDPYSSLDSRMTVGQIIGEAVVEHNMYKKGSKELENYILETMKKCGLDPYMLHRFPHQFSGGQRQRIGIARSLALKPEFVVCDEAVSALDVSIQSQIINLLMELKNNEDLTYLFISHDLSVIKHISDRIGVMYLGNMVELGLSEEIYENPLHPYTKALLSAIPTTDEIKKDRIILEGDIPSNIFPPSGCKFRTRCPLATDKCTKVVPDYREINPGHFVACHYYEKTKDMK
ncbi:MAG: ATP-binding cassette domain-containing protein [Acholeplasmataceae bacterium]|nr:ATP-binding cassette domain-containing protein [Acholeplasmataceae bacterium]